MNKSVDILIYEFRQKLTDETNNSPLPLSIKTMVIKELYDATSIVSKQQLSKQLEELSCAKTTPCDEDQE